MISESIRRFILTSIESVPHLEAILLMHQKPQKGWDAKTIAQSLFINEKNAEKVLTDLCASKIIDQQGTSYVYAPSITGLKEKIDALADVYSKNLIEVTNLIHSKTDKQAQQFGEGFKW
ncbi:MAG: hypothetical protein KGK03_08240 [Candidatus Omnitrophica bacterium]|nr:hypothetical protein [Candidatus Omnitrophota bacterium]